MNTRMRLSLGAGVLAAALLMPALSQADIMGTAYSVSSATAGNAAPGFTGTAEATFTVATNACGTGIQSLCFDSRTASNGYTLGGFLATGGATGISYMGPGAATNSVDNTILQFTGSISVTNGEVFTISHDDGLTLTIGGSPFVSDPGPTAPVTDNYTYTGPTGTFAFDLIYGECCGAPAVLKATLPYSTSVPEPSSFGLLGVGLLGLGCAVALRRRRYNG